MNKKKIIFKKCDICGLKFVPNEDINICDDCYEDKNLIFEPIMDEKNNDVSLENFD